MHQYKKYKKYKQKYKLLAGSRTYLKRQQSAPPKLEQPYHNYRKRIPPNQFDDEEWILPDKQSQDDTDSDTDSDEEYYKDFNLHGPVDPHMQSDQLTRSGYLLPSRDQNIEDYSGRLTNPYVTNMAKERINKPPLRRSKSYSDISDAELERAF